MAKKTWMTRAAGVLLPVSSLPSKYGVGTFGQAAREWVDFLARAKQDVYKRQPQGGAATFLRDEILYIYYIHDNYGLSRDLSKIYPRNDAQ